MQEKGQRIEAEAIGGAIAITALALLVAQSTYAYTDSKLRMFAHGFALMVIVLASTAGVLLSLMYYLQQKHLASGDTDWITYDRVHGLTNRSAIYALLLCIFSLGDACDARGCYGAGHVVASDLDTLTTS